MTTDDLSRGCRLLRRAHPPLALGLACFAFVGCNHQPPPAEPEVDPVSESISQLETNGAFVRKYGHGDDALIYVALGPSHCDDNGLITEEILDELRSFARISLNLQDSAVTDDGLEQLSARLQRLEVLNLRERPITDDGVRHVCAMTGLRTLKLGGTLTTDDAVLHLVNLELLESLDVMETNVTEDGLAKLAAGLPMCTIMMPPARTRQW